MKRTSLAALTLVGAILSPAAFAQGYAGVSAGQSRVDLDCAGTTTCDKTDTAWKLFGGYMFTPNLGIEGTYYDQGKARLSGTVIEGEGTSTVDAEYKGNGIGLFVVGAYPIDKFSVFAKIGAVSARIKLDATSSTLGSASASERHTNLAWGIGASYDFTKNVGARLEFERVRVKFQDEKNDADLVTLGVYYRF